MQKTSKENYDNSVKELENKRNASKYTQKEFSAKKMQRSQKAYEELERRYSCCFYPQKAHRSTVDTRLQKKGNLLNSGT